MRRRPSSLPGNLCWHGRAGPWQGRVAALRVGHVSEKFSNDDSFSMSVMSHIHALISHTHIRTCFQIPEVFAAHLVVPSFTVAIAAAPNIESRVDRYSTVTSAGPGDVVFKSIHQHCLPTHGIYRKSINIRVSDLCRATFRRFQKIRTNIYV